MKPKIGLALSGGGARGLAHIGVLKVFKREGISIDCIAGTSMGSIITAFHAAGFSIEEMEDIAIRFSRMRELAKLIDLTPTRRGLLEGNRVRTYFRQLFQEDRLIEELSIPILINAVDLISGDEIVFSKGSLLQAIFASSAVPGIFSPIKMDGKLLIDGGVLNNLPVDHAWSLGPDIVIGVDVEQDPHEEILWSDQEKNKRSPLQTPAFLKDFYRAQMIMIRKMTNEKIKNAKPTVLLSPKIQSNVSMIIGFTKAKEVIKAGEICAESNLPIIFKAIEEFEIKRG